MAQHMVAFAIDDSAFQHRKVQTAFSHDLLGSPFRFVIARAAIRASTQEANQNDLLNPALTCRFNDMPCAFDVDSFVSLFSSFSINAGTMHHAETPGKGFD